MLGNIKNVQLSGNNHMTWMEKLPKKVQNSLDNLLLETEQHEETYMEAENPPIGQIWVAMAQMNERIQKLEDLVQAQRTALKEMDVEVEVDKHLDQDLKESLKRY
jgi:predicted nuclease with TOPRIM domain